MCWDRPSKTTRAEAPAHLPQGSAVTLAEHRPALLCADRAGLRSGLGVLKRSCLAYPKGRFIIRINSLEDSVS